MKTTDCRVRFRIQFQITKTDEKCSKDYSDHQKSSRLAETGRSKEIQARSRPDYKHNCQKSIGGSRAFELSPGQGRFEQGEGLIKYRTPGVVLEG